ncbi:MAG: hypothetical protein KGM18_08965 [Sphingomonadales bacterium]|nr:hypothetical protein [Sphingomonadales bacterium]
MHDVTIPVDWWEDESEGAISTWFVEDGETVSANDVLGEVMNEKVTFELIAPAAGTIALLVSADGPVMPGQVVARIG